MNPENHYSDKCPKITDTITRKQHLRDSGRCFKCLRTGHRSSECKSSKTCYYCKENHNSALCTKNKKGDPAANFLVKANTSILLQTAVVRLSSQNESKSVKVRVLFDSGSQKSYISQRIVD